MRYLSISLLALAALSCGRSGTQEVSRFHEDGRAKPSVAIAPLLDTTSFDASWSLSEELTEGVTKLVASTGQIFVRSQADSSLSEHPFGSDLSWMKRDFPGQEFVAFLELVEHEFSPVKAKGVPAQEASANLNMAVRLRVVDLRSNNPKIVLQEMVRDTYFVPKTLIPTDYAADPWGTESYARSPMGIAHGLLTNELANRISEYILLAKSR